MDIFRSKILIKILPFSTAKYTNLFTRRLEPPQGYCAARVQWLSREPRSIPGWASILQSVYKLVIGKYKNMLESCGGGVKFGPSEI